MVKADVDNYSPSESSEEIEVQLDADCYALAMISMGTIEELHSHNHSLALYCLSCDRWGEANLDRLIRNGKGNIPVTEARFRNWREAPHLSETSYLIQLRASPVTHTSGSWICCEKSTLCGT